MISFISDSSSVSSTVQFHIGHCNCTKENFFDSLLLLGEQADLDQPKLGKCFCVGCSRSRNGELTV